jgi:hypothetical protein
MLPQAHYPGRGPKRPPAPSKCHGWGAKGALRCSGEAPGQLDHGNSGAAARGAGRADGPRRGRTARHHQHKIQYCAGLAARGSSAFACAVIRMRAVPLTMRYISQCAYGVIRRTGRTPAPMACGAARRGGARHNMHSRGRTAALVSCAARWHSCVMVRPRRCGGAVR